MVRRPLRYGRNTCLSETKALACHQGAERKMIVSEPLRKTLCRVLTLLIAFCCFARPAAPTHQSIRLRVIGFADWWADYGSIGDCPSFMDFLAIKSNLTGQVGNGLEFVKLRILNWPQDRGYARLLTDKVSKEEVYEAAREPTCDETFSSLSLKGQISFLDSRLKPSRFVALSNAPPKRPSKRSILACYQVGVSVGFVLAAPLERVHRCAVFDGKLSESDFERS